MNRRSMIRAALAVACLAAVAACVSPEKKLRDEKMSGGHLALARKLMEQQRMQEALTQADLAIRESKKNADAWMTRGQIKFFMADYAPAIEDFDRAMDLRDRFTEALSWRAWARIEIGDLAGAETDYRAALEDRTYPTPEKLHLNLGLLLVRMGRGKEGIASLKDAVTVNPAYTRGHYELGRLEEEAGNVNDARISYEAAIGGMKDSPDLNLRLALVLEKTGEGARAKEYFKRVIDLAPEGPEAVTARDHLKRLDPSS
jgi:tetratricopeptide (TPR) repeat protein